MAVLRVADAVAFQFRRGMQRAVVACVGCGREVPVTALPAMRTVRAPRGRNIFVKSSRCRDCHDEAARGIDAPIMREVRALRSRAQARAKQAGKLFALTAEDVGAAWKRQNGRCALTGREMVWGGRLSAPSIDRIDSAEGYVPSNIWLVCWAANLMKSDMSVDEFRDWCGAVVLHGQSSAEG